MSFEAKRRHPRFRVDLPARCRLAGSFHWQEVQLINLSQKGLCLQTRALLNVGDLLEFEISTTDRQGLAHLRRVSGAVQWHRGLRYGVQFRA